MHKTLEKNQYYNELEQLRQLIPEDLERVDELVRTRLSSDVVLVNQLGSYIIKSGGKRLRPLLVLLAARACGYEGSHHCLLAAVVEFIHTATLLHDDVVDASALRRGRETANALWGNEASVLVGDFLYSRAFEMMVEADDMRVMEILSRTTNIIAEGEVMQLMHCNDPDTSEARYLEVIRSKTAQLFAAAGQLGAVLGQQSEAVESCLAAYGMHLGTAFQLVDDVLDYSADPDKTGKNIGDDLAEGKPTLPLIYIMRTGNEAQAALVKKAIEKGGREHIREVLNAIESTGAIAYTARSAREEADLAIESLGPLPESLFKEALYALAEFSVNRTY